MNLHKGQIQNRELKAHRAIWVQRVGLYQRKDNSTTNNNIKMVTN